MRVFCLGCFMVGVLFACSQDGKSKDWESYMEWLNDEKHGLVQVKEANSMQLSVQYLPKDYLGYQELLKNDLPVNQKNLDSLSKSYKGGITFLVTVNSKDVTHKASALIYYGVNGEVDYKERIQLLSFHMNEYLSLKASGQEYKPVLVNYDGQNELVNKIKLLAVFSPGKSHSDDFEVVFDDPFWDTGTNHFVFEKEDMEQIPKLILED